MPPSDPDPTLSPDERAALEQAAYADVREGLYRDLATLVFGWRPLGALWTDPGGNVLPDSISAFAARTDLAVPVLGRLALFHPRVREAFLIRLTALLREHRVRALRGEEEPEWGVVGEPHEWPLLLFALDQDLVVEAAVVACKALDGQVPLGPPPPQRCPACKRPVAAWGVTRCPYTHEGAPCDADLVPDLPSHRD